MKRWDHKVETCFAVTGGCAPVLAQSGVAGWELVSAVETPDGSRTRLYFKRPSVDEKGEAGR